MCIVALIALVPGRASSSATMCSYEGVRCCIWGMRRVALIALVRGSVSISAAVSSYECFKGCICKICIVALLISVSGGGINSAILCFCLLLLIRCTDLYELTCRCHFRVVLIYWLAPAC